MPDVLPLSVDVAVSACVNAVVSRAKEGTGRAGGTNVGAGGANAGAGD